MTHTLIVGGGVIGLGIGWQLARQGQRVTLLERHQVGAGASHAAAGMLAATAEVAFEEERLLRLNHLSRDLYADFVAALEADSAQRVDYRTEGTLVVGLDRDDTAWLQRLLHYQHNLGLDAEWLGGDLARELEPGLSPNVHSAVRSPQDRQVDPPKLVSALACAFTRCGGALHEGVHVAQLIIEDDRVRGALTTDGARFEAEQVLVATGAWTRQLGGLTPAQRPRVRPVRGQMLSLQMNTEAPICRHVIRAPDAYLAPKSDGRLIIGATMEERGFEPRSTAGGVLELLRGAWEVMPGIYDLYLQETWIGFRPMTLDNEPVMGPSPDIRGLWFATGHGRNGILLTPLTAIEMARALITQRLPDTLVHCAPS